MKKVALVTGSSKGIGQAIALRLAQDGYFVYVTYFETNKGGQETLERIKKSGVEGELVKLDVTDEQSVREVFNKVNKDHGKLDLLVNNAEKDVGKSIDEATFDEWKIAFDTKLHGAWLCTKYALPLLKKSKGANIIFVSSSADERPTPDILSYAVATGALNSMIKALSVHLPEYGIRVNAVMPGKTRTDNWGDLRYDDALWKKFAEENPMKRVTTVEDIADAILLLVKDPHKFLNGNFLFVNGGSHWK